VVQVYAITDRGPNQDCGDLTTDWRSDNKPAVDSGKGFPLEKFAPTVTELELTAGWSHEMDKNGGLTVTKMMPLHYAEAREVYGKYATGRGTKPPFAQWKSATTKYGESATSLPDAMQQLPGAKRSAA